MASSKLISISFLPNTERDDIQLAWELIFRPRDWKEKLEEEVPPSSRLEEEFKRYLGVKYAFSFNSARSAFLAILNSLDLRRDDEVLLQAFTCNAAVNPIIWSGLKPVFIDCNEETFNIDLGDLKRTLQQVQGRRARVLMVQHTFGLPAELDEILEICRQQNLILIEDCAHSLGASYKGKKIGTFGKAAFFSFGRDKVISSVYGGMAVTNDDKLAEKIKKFQKKCDFPSNFWIFQQLLHPVLINFLILPLYNFFEFGRLVLLFFQKIRILSKGVSEKEKKGENPTYFPKKLPRVLAILALNQFKKLEKIISHQREIAKFYDENLREFSCGKNPRFILPKKDPERIYMRYPILIRSRDTDKILKMARKKRIFLDDGWRKTPIVPPDTDQEKIQYFFGSCPKAEKIAKEILNLPTHLNTSKDQAQKIIDFLKLFFK